MVTQGGRGPAQPSASHCDSASGVQSPSAARTRETAASMFRTTSATSSRTASAPDHFGSMARWMRRSSRCSTLTCAHESISSANRHTGAMPRA